MMSFIRVKSLNALSIYVRVQELNVWGNIKLVQLLDDATSSIFVMFYHPIIEEKKIFLFHTIQSSCAIHDLKRLHLLNDNISYDFALLTFLHNTKKE